LLLDFFLLFLMSSLRVFRFFFMGYKIRKADTTAVNPPVPFIWRSKPRYSVQERAPPGRERKKTFFFNPDRRPFFFRQ
jgi:hypothetical protein